MTATQPIRIKIVKQAPPKLVVKILTSDQQVEMSANELIRRVEEGVFELMEN